MLKTRLQCVESDVLVIVTSVVSSLSSLLIVIFSLISLVSEATWCNVSGYVKKWITQHQHDTSVKFTRKYLQDIVNNSNFL